MQPLFLGRDLYSFLFYLKLTYISFLFVWVRGTLPRFRYDKLMYLAWRRFLPLIKFQTWGTAHSVTSHITQILSNSTLWTSNLTTIRFWGRNLIDEAVSSTRNALVYLTNVHYFRIFATSWERYTGTSTGHFSVSHWLASTLFAY